MCCWLHIKSSHTVYSITHTSIHTAWKIKRAFWSHISTLVSTLMEKRNQCTYIRYFVSVFLYSADIIVNIFWSTPHQSEIGDKTFLHINKRKDEGNCRNNQGKLSSRVLDWYFNILITLFTRVFLLPFLKYGWSFFNPNITFPVSSSKRLCAFIRIELDSWVYTNGPNAYYIPFFPIMNKMKSPCWLIVKAPP